MEHTWAIAVGTPAAAMISFAKDLEPLSMAASAEGPKTGMPAARTASATPPTSGASGPTTTRSALSATASAAMAAGSVMSAATLRATAAVPGFPGATTRESTDGSGQGAGDGVLAPARAEQEDLHRGA